MDMTKFEKTKEFKRMISVIALEKIKSKKISIDKEILDLLKNNPVAIPMSKLEEEICDPLGMDIKKELNKIGLSIETKKDRDIKQKEEEEKLAKVQKLLDENENVKISLIENVIKEEDDYRGIDNTEINYYMIISVGEVDEEQIKSLLIEETEFEREYGIYPEKAKLEKIGKNKFQFWKEADDDNREFTYTYSLIESKKILSKELVEVIGTNFLLKLDNPKLSEISDDLYRKLFFNPSKIAKDLIPVIKGIGKNDFEELIDYIRKELKF